MEIISQNPALKTEILALAELLQENGAWFNKNLSLVDDNGSLSFQIRKPTSAREPIMRVPQKLFIPYELANISVKGDEFFVEPDTDQLSDVQVEITKRMFGIYNMTNKVALHRDESPWIAFRSTPDLLSKLSAARTVNVAIEKKQAYLMELPDSMGVDEFACWSFLQTRILGAKKDGGGRVQVLMPFIDYMNHDSFASPFMFQGDSEDNRVMTILNAQPYHTHQECFVTYGVYDTLDTYLNYGFPDVSSPFVRSIPMEIPIEGLGVLQVKAMSGMKNEQDVPKQLKDLSRFLPVVNRQGDDLLSVSHIFIPIDQAPHGLRRILQAVVRTFYGSEASRAEVIDTVFKVEEEILAANIRFYQGILDSVADNDAPEHLKETVSHLCRVQMNKLSKYMYKPDYFNAPDQGKAA